MNKHNLKRKIVLFLPTVVLIIVVIILLFLNSDSPKLKSNTEKLIKADGSRVVQTFEKCNTEFFESLGCFPKAHFLLGCNLKCKEGEIPSDLSGVCYCADGCNYYADCTTVTKTVIPPIPDNTCDNLCCPKWMTIGTPSAGFCSCKGAGNLEYAKCSAIAGCKYDFFDGKCICQKGNGAPMVPCI